MKDFNNRDKKTVMSNSLPGGEDQQELPENLRAALETVPEEMRQDIEKSVIHEFQMFGSLGAFRPGNEIAKKINAEHIASYLDGAREDMQNGYRERRENKIFVSLLVIIALIFGRVPFYRLSNSPRQLR